MFTGQDPGDRTVPGLVAGLPSHSAEGHWPSCGCPQSPSPSACPARVLSDTHSFSNSQGPGHARLLLLLFPLGTDSPRNSICCVQNCRLFLAAARPSPSAQTQTSTQSAWPGSRGSGSYLDKQTSRLSLSGAEIFLAPRGKDSHQGVQEQLGRQTTFVFSDFPQGGNLPSTTHKSTLSPFPGPAGSFRLLGTSECTRPWDPPKVADGDAYVCSSVSVCVCKRE